MTLDGLGLRRTRAKPTGRLVLKAMEPGENRWVGVSFRPPTGRPGVTARVDSSNWLPEPSVSGFSLGAQLGNS